MSTAVDKLMTLSPVIPVLVIDQLDDAVPLARALVAGGVSVLEVTLRPPVALEAIRLISEEVKGAVVGAGTLTDARQFAAVQAAGAQFAISPGTTESLLEAGLDSDIPYLPAVATVSEMMACMELGFTGFKLFPAGAVGGVPALKAFAGPFPDVRFCPTGGVGPDNYREYLALPNVSCVGGSWLAPRALVAENDWSAIQRLATDAVTQSR